MTPLPSTEGLLASLNKPLPYSDEDEQAILSCILQHPSRLDEAPPPEQFYHEANRTILSTLLTMRGVGTPIDLITLTRSLRESGKLDMVGGPAAISGLFAFVPIPAHWPFYLKAVREKYQTRQMIGALAAGIAHLQAFTGVDGASATDALEHCQKLVCEAANDTGEPDIPFRPIGEILNSIVDEMEDRSRNPGKIPGVSTGFAKLDKFSGGLEKGTLTVIAAKPSEGKSALCRQIIENACLEGHACDIFTIEMTDSQEGTRLLCSQATVDAQNMKLGMLTRGEQSSLVAKIPRISKWDLRIIDASECTIERICKTVARRSKGLNPGQELLVVVDYIQICKTSENSTNREREVAHITKTAKQCAKATGARFLMPSQLNEQNEARESKSIEQDADNFWMIIEPEDDKPKKAWQKEAPKEDNLDRDLFLKKTRNGMRRKRVPLRSVMQFFRFEARIENEN